MTTNDKIIKNKLGLLKLAQHLSNVTQTCKVMGYSRDSFYRFKPPVFPSCRLCELEAAGSARRRG